MSNNRAGTLRIFGVLANKWTVSIMQCLAVGDKRPLELMDRIEGISHKVLTQTLRQMQDCRLVDRKVHAVVPPRVDYGLTPLGVSLIKPLDVLEQWASEHATEIAQVEGIRKASRPPRK